MGSVAPRRGRPPKARIEGGEWELVGSVSFGDKVVNPGIVAGLAKPADPVPGDNGAALRRIVDYFKATEPDAWEELRLCPLQHGLEDMANRMRG